MQDVRKDVRCPDCHRLLGRITGNGEIQCPKCKAKVTFDTANNKIQSERR